MIVIQVCNAWIDPGLLEIEPAVRDILTETDVFEGLIRHLSGDWGDVTEEERKANDAAQKCGGRLFSRYSTIHGKRFWIITNEERSRTIVQLPVEH